MNAVSEHTRGSWVSRSRWIRRGLMKGATLGKHSCNVWASVSHIHVSPTTLLDTGMLMFVQVTLSSSQLIYVATQQQAWTFRRFPESTEIHIRLRKQHHHVRVSIVLYINDTYRQDRSRVMIRDSWIWTQQRCAWQWQNTCLCATTTPLFQISLRWQTEAENSYLHAIFE